MFNNNSFEKEDINDIKEEFDFGIGLELQNNPLAETMKTIRPKQMEFEINKEMKDTVFDNIVKKSTMNKNKINKNNHLYNQNNNPNLQQSFCISAEEMGEILKSLKENNFISKDKFDNLSNQNDYLKSRELRRNVDNTFNTYLNECDWDYINKLTNYILNQIGIRLNKYDYNYSINPCIGLFYLIEASFGFDRKKINQMNEKYNLLNNRYIFYRKIKGDGN